jgi:hypothetical protein
MLRAEGVCRNDGSCFQECDMGSFKIALDCTSLLLRL